jgi:hypothetical protein
VRQHSVSRPANIHYIPLAAARASPFVGGGAEGIRTPDLRRAKAALSQLSYGPARRRVGQPGIEPGTSVLSGLRSSRLSYWPAADAFESTRPAARPAPAPGREESGAESVCGWNVTREERQLEMFPRQSGVERRPGWDRPGKRPCLTGSSQKLPAGRRAP